MTVPTAPQAVDPSPVLVELAAAISRHGLILRGGFYPERDEVGLQDAATVVLVGNAGRAMWEAFEPYLDEAPDPMNRWTERVVRPIAAAYGARALFPFGEPHWPFQRWARRAETSYPSPLGLLIHPEYGLWHAYRAALLFPARLALGSVEQASAAMSSPCAACADMPCLRACPVGAFSGSAYDVGICAAHLGSPAQSCAGRGCHARNACPVGRDYCYTEAQMRFHIAAFSRTVVVARPAA